MPRLPRVAAAGVGGRTAVRGRLSSARQREEAGGGTGELSRLPWKPRSRLWSLRDRRPPGWWPAGGGRPSVGRSGRGSSRRERRFYTLLL